MPCTDVAHGPTRHDILMASKLGFLGSVDANTGTSLGACYAIPGTDVAYGTTCAGNAYDGLT
eukprot:1168056-Rhodomonas_salina.1